MDQPRNRTDPKKFVVLWNMQYPFDYWWRQKHRIAFGSQEHLAANHIFMYLEWEEDALFKQMAEEMENEKLELEMPKFSGSGKKAVKLTKKEIDKEFEDIDIAQFNNT